MSVRTNLLTAPARFCADRRGAFAISFAMLGSSLLALAAFGFEGSRYITERARLSDAMEQAALALTAEDNGEGAARNYSLSSDYFRAYMRHDKSVFKPTVIVKRGTSATNHNLSYVEYRVSGQTLQDSWFSSSWFPSFDKQVKIGDNGAARKYRSNMDVLFVTDFSGSMNESFGSSTKLMELKRIVLQLSEELFAYDMSNKVGFVPFGWGAKNGGNCDLPFVVNSAVPPNLISSNDKLTSLERYVNISGTVASIPNKVNQIYIPLAQASKDACLNESSSWKVPLTSDYNQIAQINGMTASGGTLVSTGLLLATPYLVEGTESRKVMVIVSDGTDDPNTVQITPKLINAGMCDRIREVISTEESVGKITFIGINYAPTFDWKRCVGEKNFYLPQNIKELEDDLRRAVFEEVGHNVLKD
ncbi:protein TadG, associated with Flp pilus assembly [Mixta tenebrionis]|uniref:Protein TadG, associated with Flp pilus assembly n=1 Tax=Mixta tenebrionis TaxID=2562439 RepID=A0A506V9A4_9GAMM|nr:pilus assembly protein [Mixta tenebrionis]TPW42062.1 protein TadG, associated with Flp pilus assembly [Mixta tenebrionis]